MISNELGYLANKDYENLRKKAEVISYMITKLRLSQIG